MTPSQQTPPLMRYHLSSQFGLGPHAPAWSIVCISDTHGCTQRMKPIPDGDILIHGGDFTNEGFYEDIQDFVTYLKALPHRVKVVIAGNHDVTMQADFYPTVVKEFHQKFAKDQNFNAQEYSASCIRLLDNPELQAQGIFYLQDQALLLTTDHDGAEQSLKIHGSPWQPEFFNWAFNLPRGPALDEKWELIPSDCDVVVTHGPAYGILDANMDGEPCGCEDLARHLQHRVKPRLHVFGHIHEGYGTSMVSGTLHVNACTCTPRYRPTNPAVAVLLPFDRDATALLVPPTAPPTALST